MNKMGHYTLVAVAVLAGNLGAATFDVAVVGGGAAGIGAALASAKTGAKTVLVERDARLGGTTVSAEVLPIGLYDVRPNAVKRFYENGGTGALTAGPDSPTLPVVGSVYYIR